MRHMPRAALNHHLSFVIPPPEKIILPKMKITKNWNYPEGYFGNFQRVYIYALALG